MNEPEKVKTMKRRSRLYPRYDLEEIISFVRKLNELGGERVSEATVASSIGKGTKNSTFNGRISSGKQFGLLVADNGRLSMTQMAKEILFPRENEEMQHALKLAFANPPLYKALISAFKGRVLPEVSSLSNRLLHEFDIEPNAKGRAARNFLRSAEYAGVIRNGILVVDVGEEFNTEKHSEGERTPEELRGLGVEETEQKLFVFVFKGGVKLTVPRDEKSSAAILDGKLKEAKDKLEEFANSFLGESPSMPSVLTSRGEKQPLLESESETATVER